MRINIGRPEVILISALHCSQFQQIRLSDMLLSGVDSNIRPVGTRFTFYKLYPYCFHELRQNRYQRIVERYHVGVPKVTRRVQYRSLLQRQWVHLEGIFQLHML